MFREDELGRFKVEQTLQNINFRVVFLNLTEYVPSVCLQKLFLQRELIVIFVWTAVMISREHKTAILDRNNMTAITYTDKIMLLQTLRLFAYTLLSLLPAHGS